MNRKNKGVHSLNSKLEHLQISPSKRLCFNDRYFHIQTSLYIFLFASINIKPIKTIYDHKIFMISLSNVGSTLKSYEMQFLFF